MVPAGWHRHQCQVRFASWGQSGCHADTPPPAQGSALSPVSCNSTILYGTDVVSLPEVDSTAEANTLTLRLFIRNSGGNRSTHRTATLGVDSSLD